MPTRTPAPTAAEAATTPTPATGATPVPSPPVTFDELERFGVAGAWEFAAPAAEAGLPFGRFLNWRIMLELPPVPGVESWQMVRLSEAGVLPSWEQIDAVLAANPGSVWLVGNEPDVRWQDNVTPERYAALYREVYTYIKERDPEARVGVGGVAQATPLRLAYLDRVLAAYQDATGTPLPADWWSLHAFVLREERDSWGVDIPPGFSVDTGTLYSIEDHGDAAIVEQHVRAFRDWMAANGYRETPLAVTEFGILLPFDYGFPPEFVAAYLVETMEFLRTATGENGLPDDDGRLVQAWFWYSIYDDGAYPTGNLFDFNTRQLTPLGEAYRAYVLAVAAGE